MNIKSFLATFAIASSVSISAVQASDSILFQESRSPAASGFSWTGFYIGGQAGGFSSNVTANALDVDIPLSSDRNDGVDRWTPVDKKYLPQLFGMRGGIYAGSNINLSNNLVVGVDTDMMWSGQKDTKTIIISDDLVPTYRTGSGGSSNTEQGRERIIISPFSPKNLGRAMYQHVARSGDAAGQYIIFNHSLKEKWTGATRVRIGFAADRIMPYVAGGISYVELQDTLSVVIGTEENKADESKTMIGYTFGGGVDFALTNSIIVRTEYRYSDFGKKKFAKEEVDLSYKTNNFRVGVAYKF
ncbi:Hemin binding protein E [Bartonella clarridgeiae 73]|uniref:Hemin binding protein E n=1 Tax=Bartonella clarridgeiae (strain CCUG 45776 / CIP 104772 / 73) TaxID=696125 RepID=E6YG91_BARC7|nr:outer membrane protein [Bartonella clarridgeiae]WCR55514.1 MAG: Hemin binding protein b [Bartonella clarridgeiae]CBI75879.1 Hemin binding protein E [Bartonella clarridgeiae 73]